MTTPYDADILAVQQALIKGANAHGNDDPFYRHWKLEALREGYLRCLADTEARTVGSPEFAALKKAIRGWPEADDIQDALIAYEARVRDAGETGEEGG